MMGGVRWVPSAEQMAPRKAASRASFSEKKHISPVFPGASGEYYFTDVNPENITGASSWSAELFQNCLPGRSAALGPILCPSLHRRPGSYKESRPGVGGPGCTGSAQRRPETRASKAGAAGVPLISPGQEAGDLVWLSLCHPPSPPGHRAGPGPDSSNPHCRSGHTAAWSQHVFQQCFISTRR